MPMYTTFDYWYAYRYLMYITNYYEVEYLSDLPKYIFMSDDLIVVRYVLLDLLEGHCVYGPNFPLRFPTAHAKPLYKITHENPLIKELLKRSQGYYGPAQ